MTAPYRFGRAEVRPSERQLLVDGQLVAIGARAFNVLQYLIQRRERIVAKSELLEAVWPGLVVEENNLQVQISTLRKALGASVITTIPGQGYQFTASIEAQGNLAPASAVTTGTTDVTAPTPDQRPLVESVASSSSSTRDNAHDVESSFWITRQWRSRAFHTLAVASIAVAIALASLLIASTLLRSKSRVSPALPVSAISNLTPEHSIAVLPFADMSEKKDQEYFADGMTEEILDLLSRVRGLQVVARTSAFSFKGKSDDIPTIAQKLKVANVLEGSVRKSGNLLRVSAQLVRADTGYHLWSETFERNQDDVFKIQDAIADAVVKALQISLLSGAMPSRSETENIEAYTLYLQANAMLSRASTKAELGKAVDYIQRSIELDPKFAPAWSMLSRVRSSQGAQGYMHEAQAREEARRAAERSLALDPTLTWAHAAMAQILFFDDWDWAGTEAQVQKSLEIDPNSPALRWSGYVAEVTGQNEEAVRILRRVAVNDPVDPSAFLYLGTALYRAGRFNESEVALRQAVDLWPGLSDEHWLAGRLKLATGDPGRALVEFERGQDDARTIGRALALFALGRRSEADAALATAEKELGARAPFRIAQIHAFRGEVDLAFSWLDRAFRQRDFRCVFVKGDRLLRNLEADPRYKAFLIKLNLPV
jgi:TolB-like protein/DNA-binding winged helix-turn-helix (wHTH) protein/predicted Zn-dependent protease